MNLSLRDIRKRSGMTQDQLAKAIGATKRQVGAWERGENDLPMDYAWMIADLLHCSIDDIAGRETLPIMPEFPLSVDEYDLLSTYRELSDSAKEALLTVAHTLAGGTK